jgi:hypothetical protein
MDQRLRRLIAMGAVALVCLLLITSPVPAQQRDPLQAAFTALRAGHVHMVHLTGFGATYDDVSRSRVPLASYEADVDVARDAATTPQGFLKAAHDNHAGTRAVPLGIEVTFTAGGRSYIGYLNGNDEVDRVHTWVDDAVLGHVMVETLFRDYESSARGVPFPRHITRSHGGRPVLDLWLSAIDIQ